MQKYDQDLITSKKGKYVAYKTVLLKTNSELDNDTPTDATSKEFEKPSHEESIKDIVINTVPHKAFLYGMEMGYYSATRQIEDLCEIAERDMNEYLAQDGSEEELKVLQACVNYLDHIYDKTFHPDDVPNDDHYVVQSQGILNAIAHCLEDVDICDWPWLDKD